METATQVPGFAAGRGRVVALLRLGSYGGPRGDVAVSYERGTPVGSEQR